VVSGPVLEDTLYVEYRDWVSYTCEHQMEVSSDSGRRLSSSQFVSVKVTIHTEATQNDYALIFFKIKVSYT
jgi:hypothetical protein